MTGYKEGRIGGFIANGFEAEDTSVDAANLRQFRFSIMPDETIFVRAEEESDWTEIPRSAFKVSRNLFDQIMQTTRFRVAEGPYAHEYVISRQLETDDFFSMMDYIRWLGN
ncbi:hypothetical protein BSR28_01030 [Boudabousia liubingyangii]|uniref:hypothetical protein n=1 Tax=Boudabousia liubingyangii TaxID=1921764 RepID=UPI00093FA5B9|nr:hypothetical protein [Boudabousia liubingyangii]OKL48320.1 hypothetical protein BSR28_01030 [Boudabousia liubingyangii]